MLRLLDFYFAVLCKMWKKTASEDIADFSSYTWLLSNYIFTITAIGRILITNDLLSNFQILIFSRTFYISSVLLGVILYFYFFKSGRAKKLLVESENMKINNGNFYFILSYQFIVFLITLLV